jgi:hypothetical protein
VRLVTSCLAVIAVIAIACQSRTGSSLDSIAAEYVELARASDRADSGLLERIGAARRGLVSRAGEDARRTFLDAQLEALEHRARFVAGERISIREESRRLDLFVPSYDGARAAALRSELDAALPGTGSLSERLARHKRETAIPRSRLDAEVQEAVASCRTRTPVPRDVPDRGVDVRYVIERPWPAFTTYSGDQKSLVELRRDSLWTRDDLEALVCHETYPGHHVQNLVWASLRDRLELTVQPMFTPHGVMAERSAVAATALSVPRDSRPAVARILDDFAPLALATAIATLDGEMPRDDAMARLRGDLLMPDAESFLEFVERYRSMAAAYVTPLPGVRDWPSYFALLRSPDTWAATRTQ